MAEQSTPMPDNLPFSSVLDERRAPAEVLPTIQARQEDVRQYLAVETRMRRNSKLTVEEACRLCEVDPKVYYEVRRKAVATNGEAFGFHKRRGKR